jgi:hypothetical protein
LEFERNPIVEMIYPSDLTNHSTTQTTVLRTLERKETIRNMLLRTQEPEEKEEAASSPSQHQPTNPNPTPNPKNPNQQNTNPHHNTSNNPIPSPHKPSLCPTTMRILP